MLISLALPITSKIKGYPFEVALPKGLEVEGVIFSDQIKNLDFVAREIDYICEAPHEVLVDAQKNVLALVG